jgi:hypothetical protein
MAQVIKIKRSSSTATPATLNQGELAYSSEGTSNKLFIGNPGTGDVTVIGGKFFTDMLDHTAGTLTASSAIIVDSSSKIDVLNVDNITLNGNSITSTDTNGNLELTPNGAGNLVLDGTNWPQTSGTNGYILTTNGSGQSAWAAPASSSFTLSDGTNTDTFNTGETLTFTGGTDITATVSDNEVTIDYSGNTPALYDNAGTPTLASGITALEVRTAISVDAAGTDNSTNVTLETSSHDYLSLSGQQITLAAIDLTTDVTGALPNANLANDSITIGTTEIDLGTSEGDIIGLTSLGVDNLSLDGSTVTTTTGDLTLDSDSGTVVVAGNLTVSGTTTTVNSETLTINDNIITLNNNEAGTPSQNAGIEVERGTSANVLLRWNETSDVWETTTDGTNYFTLLTSNNFESILTDVDGGTF